MPVDRRRFITTSAVRLQDDDHASERVAPASASAMGLKDLGCPADEHGGITFLSSDFGKGFLQAQC
jgi:hypothetical protein